MHDWEVMITSGVRYAFCHYISISLCWRRSLSLRGNKICMCAVPEAQHHDTCNSGQREKSANGSRLAPLSW